MRGTNLEGHFLIDDNICKELPIDAEVYVQVEATQYYHDDDAEINEIFADDEEPEELQGIVNKWIEANWHKACRLAFKHADLEPYEEDCGRLEQE